MAAAVLNKKKPKFYFGGLASAVAVTVTQPVDLLKVRQQTSKQSLSLLNAARGVVQNEGVLGLYNGMSASWMRQLVWSSIRFGAYDKLKFVVAKDGNPGFVSQLAIAIGAGIAGGTAGNPFDMVMVRMQADKSLPIEKQRNYKHVFNGLYRLIKEEGLSQTMKGLTPNVGRAVLITVCQIITYERCKLALYETGWFGDGVPLYFWSSMVSGLVSVTISNPVDVLKSRVMNSPKGTYRNVFHCAYDLLKKDGSLAFFRGWTPAYMRLGPQTVIIFLVKEYLTHSEFWNPSPKGELGHAP